MKSKAETWVQTRGEGVKPPDPGPPLYEETEVGGRRTTVQWRAGTRWIRMWKRVR